MNRFNEPIDDEFEKLHLFFQEGRFISDSLFSSFKKSFFDFLTKHKNDDYTVHDSLFQNFNPFWLNSDGSLKSFQFCDLVFDKILSLVHEWEDENRPSKIHKGTPYYFYGTISILKGDIDKGLLLMHQAYGEDKRLGRIGTERPTPAECFILLEDSIEEQFFREKVIETVNFLNEKLESYRIANQASLNIDLLRAKFLKKSSYYNEAFFFVYCIYKLEKLINKIETRIRENAIASYLETTFIFELCKLVEILLKKIYSVSDLSNCIVSFSQDENVNLNLRGNNLNFFNEEIESKFKNTITGLINHNYSNINFLTRPLNIEYDIALTYCLRNFGGHKIEEQETIYKEFSKIVQSILNSIFFIIEKKY